MRVSRCYGSYLASWDGPGFPCGRAKGHGGVHGPAPVKPALAIEHSPTSRAAAAAIEPVRGTLREKVLTAIREAGGLADEEGIDRLGMPASTYRPRRCELVEQNLVADSGETRLTRSGRKAAIWVAVKDRLL